MRSSSARLGMPTSPAQGAEPGIGRELPYALIREGTAFVSADSAGAGCSHRVDELLGVTGWGVHADPGHRLGRALDRRERHQSQQRGQSGGPLGRAIEIGVLGNERDAGIEGREQDSG